ncbi:hypothetical protein, partial [Methanobrevibacter sp.]|uniref:hypothetical protein n=1 Tax=Methanobrevibacter sp. TaxID=66852 RepID=UPI002E7A0810
MRYFNTKNLLMISIISVLLIMCAGSIYAADNNVSSISAHDTNILFDGDIAVSDIDDDSDLDDEDWDDDSDLDDEDWDDDSDLDDEDWDDDSDL